MKKTYSVVFDVIDDTVKFAEEAKDKSKDIENIPMDIMVNHIKKTIDKLKMSGVSIANLKVTLLLDVLLED